MHKIFRRRYHGPSHFTPTRRFDIRIDADACATFICGGVGVELSVVPDDFMSKLYEHMRFSRHIDTMAGFYRRSSARIIAGLSRIEGYEVCIAVSARSVFWVSWLCELDLISIDEIRGDETEWRALNVVDDDTSLRACSV